MKLIFIKILILTYFDFDKEIWIKIDVFDYIIIVILSQIKLNKLLYSIAFIFRKMLLMKCNYEIYNKEFFVIIKTFEKWYSKLINILIKNLIKIFINYRNLKYFIIIK